VSGFSAGSAVADDGLDYLDRLRAQVKLSGFGRLGALGHAAQQHARYLDQRGAARPNTLWPTRHPFFG
jgi:hypothetical protein